MTEETLPLLLNSVKQGLDDPVDDVRAVAAMSLLPVTDKLIALMPQEVREFELSYLEPMGFMVQWVLMRVLNAFVSVAATESFVTSLGHTGRT